MTTKPDAPEIRLPVPPRVYAKLKEIAGFSSVENWARRVLVDAAEEASPSLRDSRMWSGDTSVWYSLVNPSDDDEVDDLVDRSLPPHGGWHIGPRVAECAFCTTRIRMIADQWTADDGTTACTDTSAPYVPHKPAEA